MKTDLNSRNYCPNYIVVPTQKVIAVRTEDILSQAGLSASDFEITLTILHTVCATAVDYISTFIGRIKSSNTEKGQQMSGYLFDYAKKKKGVNGTFLSVLSATESILKDTNKSLMAVYKNAATIRNGSYEEYLQRFCDAMDEGDSIVKPILDAAKRYAFSHFSSNKEVRDPWMLSDLFACFLTVKCLTDCYEGFTDTDAFYIIREIKEYNHLNGRAMRSQLDKIIRTIGLTEKEKEVFSTAYSSSEIRELYIDIQKVRCSAEYIDRIFSARGDSDKQYRNCYKSFADKWEDSTEPLQYYKDKYNNLFEILNI